MKNVLISLVAVVAMLFAGSMFASECFAGNNVQRVRVVRVSQPNRVVLQNRNFNRNRIAIVNGQAVVVRDFGVNRRDLALERALRVERIRNNQARVNQLRLQRAQQLRFERDLRFQRALNRRAVVRRGLVGDAVRFGVGAAILGGDVRDAVRLGIGLRVLGL